MAGGRFFNAVEKIYGAALAPETWPDALGRLARLLGASRVRLWVEQDGFVRHWDNQSESAPLSSLAVVLEELPHVPQPNTNPSILVSRSTSGRTIVAVYRSGAKFRTADAALLKKLGRHVELALQIGHRLSQASVLENESICIAEHVGAAFQVSDLRSGPDRFAFAGPSSISMPTDRAPIAISTELLHELYGLTLAEAKLCNALLQESGLRGAACRLGISLNTAKTQLQAIFQKTGVPRQSELLRIFLSGPAQLFSAATTSGKDLQKN